MSAVLLTSNDAYGLVCLPSTQRACSEDQFEQIAFDRSYKQVRAYGRWLMAQGRSMAAIRMRLGVLSEALGRCRRQSAVHFDLRSHAGLSRRTVQRLSRELAQVKTKHGNPHFTCAGSTIFVNNMYARTEDEQQQKASNEHWAEVRRARQKRRNQSAAGRAARRRYKQKQRRKAHALKAEAAAASQQNRGNLARKARKNGASDRRIYPQQNSREMPKTAVSGGYTHDHSVSWQESVTTHTSSHSTQEGGTPHPQPKKEINKKPFSEVPTGTASQTPNILDLRDVSSIGPDRDRTEMSPTEAVARSTVRDTKPIPQYELGSEVSLSTNENTPSFAEQFPDYHERIDSKEDDVLEQYKQWLGLENESLPSTDKTLAPQPQDHAVPVGTSEKGFLNNFSLNQREDLNPGLPAVASKHHGDQVDLTPAIDQPSTADWLGSDELLSMGADAVEAWAAHCHRDSNHRARMAHSLRRLYGKAGDADRYGKPPPKPGDVRRQQAQIDFVHSDRAQKEKIAKRNLPSDPMTAVGDVIKNDGEAFLKSLGITKQSAMRNSHVENTPEDVIKPDCLLVEVMEKAYYLRFSAIKAAKLQTPYIARAAFILERKIRNREKINNIEGWILNAARSYQENGVPEDTTMDHVRPFVDDNEAAEYLAPRYFYMHDGKGARRWS